VYHDNVKDSLSPCQGLRVLFIDNLFQNLVVKSVIKSTNTVNCGRAAIKPPAAENVPLEQVEMHLGGVKIPNLILRGPITTVATVPGLTTWKNWYSS